MFRHDPTRVWRRIRAIRLLSTVGLPLEALGDRTKSSGALRGLIDAIVLTPNQGELQIELKGIWRRCFIASSETR
jgi:hypothetical protein